MHCPRCDMRLTCASIAARHFIAHVLRRVQARVNIERFEAEMNGWKYL